MGLFSRTSAESLDSTAAKAYEVGVKFGGKAVGRVADAVSNAVLAPARRHIDQPCTHKDHSH